MDEILNGYTICEYVTFYLMHITNIALIKGIDVAFYNDIIEYLSTMNKDELKQHIIPNDDTMCECVLFAWSLELIITAHTTINIKPFYFNTINEHRVKYLKMMGVESEYIHPRVVIDVMSSGNEKKALTRYLIRNGMIYKALLLQFRKMH